MKKFIIKDKLLRLALNDTNNKMFILKSIFKNTNLFLPVRQKAYLKVKRFSFKLSKISLINRCLYSVNKKRFNKFTFFSRIVLLKLIKNGKISGFQKSSW